MYKETLRLELALPLPESWTAMGIKVEVQFDVYIYSLYLCIRRSVLLVVSQRQTPERDFEPLHFVTADIS